MIEQNDTRCFKPGPGSVPSQQAAIIRTATKTRKPFKVHELGDERILDIKELAVNLTVDVSGEEKCNFHYTGHFIMYSGNTKIDYKKTIGHLFTRPVQIGTNQSPPQ